MICNIEQQFEANLETTVDTDTAVEPKPFHERARDAREHLASGVTLQYTIQTTHQHTKWLNNWKINIHKIININAPEINMYLHTFYFVSCCLIRKGRILMNCQWKNVKHSVGGSDPNNAKMLEIKSTEHFKLSHQI